MINIYLFIANVFTPRSHFDMIIGMFLGAWRKLKPKNPEETKSEHVEPNTECKGMTNYWLIPIGIIQAVFFFSFVKICIIFCHPRYLTGTLQK